VTYIPTDLLQESSNLFDLEKPFVPVEMSQITDMGSEKFRYPVQESSNPLTYIHPDIKHADSMT